MITVFSDASFCPTSGAAGWGGWFKRNGDAVGTAVGGPLKRGCLNIHEAELSALANTLSVARSRDSLIGVEVLMLQSDSIRALGILLHLVKSYRSRHPDGAEIIRIRNNISKRERVVAAKIEEIVTAYGIKKVLLRHVKGHKAGNGRQWVQQECDRYARLGMQAARKEVENA